MYDVWIYMYELDLVQKLTCFLSPNPMPFYFSLHSFYFLYVINYHVLTLKYVVNSFHNIEDKDTVRVNTFFVEMEFSLPTTLT